MTAAAARKAEALAGAAADGGGSLLPPVPVASFTLPEPPSTNKLFKNVKGRGRVKTSHYQDWLMCAITAMRQQKIKNVDGHSFVVLGVERNSMQADIDNRIKATLDAIVKAGVLSDDSFVTGIAAVWLPKANAMAHVQIYHCQPLTLAFHPSQNGASGSVVISAPSNEKGDDDGDFAL